MKSFATYQRERKELAESLEQLNNSACRHFAQMLRLNDEQKRLSMELGQKPEDLIPAQYFEIVYRVLSFGKLADRFVLLVGSEQEIDKLIARIQLNRGFTDDKDKWFEI